MNDKKKVALIVDDENFFGPFKEAAEGRFQVRTVARPSKIDQPRNVKDLMWVASDRVGSLTHVTKMHAWADLVFYEWASRMLIRGSKKSGKAKVATRLHRHELWSFADKINWDNVDAVVFVCEAMERRFRKMVPDYGGTTRVIWNYVDIERYSPPKKRMTTMTMGILGGVLPRKRVYEAILAFSEARKSVPGLRLKVAGRWWYPEYNDAVRELVKKLELQDVVQLEGFVDDILEWYRSLDIILSFSHHESTHLTLFEGMSTGCMPLAHFWDGVEEFLPAERIFSSESDFVGKVKSYYDLSEGERRRISDDGRKLMLSRYSGKKQIEEFVQFLEEMLS